MAQYRQLISAGGIAKDNEGEYWHGIFLGSQGFVYMDVCNASFCCHNFAVFQRFLPLSKTPPWLLYRWCWLHVDRGDSRVQWNCHISDPSTSILHGLCYNPSSVLVFRQTLRALLPHYRLNDCLPHWNHYFNLHSKRRYAIFWHVSNPHWSIHCAKCRSYQDLCYRDVANKVR